jgi:hypothetical protein
MSNQPYRRGEVEWPIDNVRSLTLRPTHTVVGPGIGHRQVVELLGVGAPPARYGTLVEMLNVAFLMGRRSTQQEMRVALGLSSWGGRISLKED